MIPWSSLRFIAIVAAMLPAAGCQSLFGEEPNTSVGAQRLAATAPVASSQRLGEDGYPLLGAFPGKAATQLTDAEVSSDRSRFNGLATQRSAGSAPAGADTAGYDAAVARAAALRASQAEAVQAQMAKKPKPKPKPATRTGPSPGDVLKQIQSGT